MNMNTKSGLTNENGDSALLKSVHLEGKLEGLLLTMVVKQRYKNDTSDNIEATYTFPAGWGSNLMSFSVELNGKRMQAVALAKKTAETKYEEAIESGDTPVMLEKSPLGLYTTDLGNLKAGEEAVIEIEYAQLLRFEKGRVRITVPTVIGERYGDAGEDGYISAHQTVDSDLLVEYPFTASLDILGQMSLGSIACPSHQVNMVPIEGGKRLQLEKGGLLDRDFIVTIEDLKGESFVSASEDDGAYAVVASFCPKLVENHPEPLVLKVLVDCSGSMQGDSIEQAQMAMHELILRLSEKDMISYSRFGSNVIHTSTQLEKCTPRYIQNTLAKAVHETDADLGGTEMHKALESTFKIGYADAGSKGCDLLLITDGDIWEIEAVVKKAKRSNHRIFAIGVGSAPAESLLRDLAEQTGGACELVTPTESIVDAVLRMMNRIQSARTNEISVQWQDEVLWQSELPNQVFSEETIHVYARMKNKPVAAPVLTWKQNKVSCVSSAAFIEWDSTGALPRMVAGSEILGIKDQSAAEELALKYQLASKYTNLLLVHVREEADKAEGLPSLHKIKQMSAAGWGGLGSVSLDIVRHSMASVSYSTPMVMRRVGLRPSSQVGEFLKSVELKDYDIPAFLRRQTEDDADLSSDFIEDDFSPQMLVEKFNELCLISTKFNLITSELTELVLDEPFWEVFLLEIVESKDQMPLYWACLIRWLASNVSGVGDLSRHGQRVINAQLANVSADEIQAVEENLIRTFIGISKLRWEC